MNTPPHPQDQQRSNPEEQLPGRVVDVIAAAGRGAGISLTSITVHLDDDGRARGANVHTTRKDPGTALHLFAALGATATISEVYGPQDHPQATVEAPIPALGLRRMSIIVTDDLPPQPADPAALIADVDARRAQDQQ